MGLFLLVTRSSFLRDFLFPQSMCYRVIFIISSVNSSYYECLLFAKTARDINLTLHQINNIFFLIFVWRSSIIFVRYRIRCRNLLRNTRDKSHYRYCRTVSLVQMLRSIDRVYQDRITI